MHVPLQQTCHSHFLLCAGQTMLRVMLLLYGIGWSTAEAIVSYLIPLWIGARGMEFSWQYIEMGVTSNINLVCTICFI
jgi:hypothetical protein